MRLSPRGKVILANAEAPIWAAYRMPPLESKTWTYSITGKSGRGARRCGGARSGRTGYQQNCSPRRQTSLAPSKMSKKRLLSVSPEVRTSETLCKPMEEQSSRLTTGSFPVYSRFIRRTRSALSSWLLTSGPTIFVPVNPFHARHVREPNRLIRTDG